MPTLPPAREQDNIIAVLDSIRRHVAEITERNDPDEILAADDALWSLSLDREMQRRQTVTHGPDSGIIPADLARSLADGTWRRP